MNGFLVVEWFLIGWIKFLIIDFIGYDYDSYILLYFIEKKNI